MNMNRRVSCAVVVFAYLLSAAPAMADWVQRQKITSTPRGVGAQHGNAVAIGGSTMVVGARFDSTTASQAGAAFVYVLSGGTWTQQAKLLAPDGAATDKFGYSVAISENTIVVGAYNADAPLSNGGAAYVFVRSGTTWSFQQKLTAGDGTADDQFGVAVAVTGEVIVVGANHADLPSNAEAGAAYVFLRTGTVWAQTQRLSPSLDVLIGDHFGDSIAIGGNRIAIGASGDDTPETSAGAVYVFVETGAATYGFQQKLTIAGGTNGDLFGFSVAFDGSAIVGGAPEDTPIIGQPAIGCAYVFTYNGATWSMQQKLSASDGLAFDRFGYSVAIYGDTVAVGAREDDTAVGPDAGSAYVFTRSGTVWTEKKKLAPADPFNGDRFGVSVALSPAGVLAVGAAEKALSSPNGQGAVYTYVFLPPASRTFDFDGDSRTDRTIFRPSNGVWYSALSSGASVITGWGVSTDLDVAGDYDGDGKTDIAVFRPSAGTWYILQSSNSSIRSVQWGLTGDIPLTGDLDGDGMSDIVIFRPGTGIWYALESTNGYVALGWGVNGDLPLLGDYDGDGKADHTIYRPSSGVWYISRSSGGTLIVGWGSSTDIPVMGDFDGDGKSDISVFRPSSGEWYLHLSSGLDAVLTWGLSGDIPVSGDWDGDGKSDITIWRPSNGVWFTQFIAGGSAVVGWGVNGDRPIGRRPGS